MAVGPAGSAAARAAVPGEPAAGDAGAPREAAGAARRHGWVEQGRRHRAHAHRRGHAHRRRARIADERGCEMKTIRRSGRTLSMRCLLAVHAATASAQPRPTKRLPAAAECRRRCGRSASIRTSNQMLPLDDEFTDEHGPSGADRRLLRQASGRPRLRLLRLPDALPAEPEQPGGTLGVMSENPGEDFEVVSISIDPARNAGDGAREEGALRRAIRQAVDCARLALPDGHGGQHPATDESCRLPLRLGRSDCSNTRIRPASSSPRRQGRCRATCSASTTARAICASRVLDASEEQISSPLKRRCSTATTTT